LVFAERARAFPFQLNRNGALASCFDAFSSREPVSTSLENALEADDERAHGQKEYETACHDGEKQFVQAIAPASAHYRSRLEGFGCVNFLTHVRRSSGKPSGIKAARRLFEKLSQTARIAMCGEKPV
jgi:hypothetical protein